MPETPKHWIIVEPESQVAGLLKLMIKRAFPEQEVTHFQDKTSAIEHIKSHGAQIGLAIIDHGRDTPGLHVLAVAKEWYIPSIVISSDHGGYQQEAFDAGANHIILKPKLNKFITKIRELI